jgi:hypothetical protein
VRGRKEVNRPEKEGAREGLVRPQGLMGCDKELRNRGMAFRTRKGS